MTEADSPNCLVATTFARAEWAVLVCDDAFFLLKKGQFSRALNFKCRFARHKTQHWVERTGEYMATFFDGRTITQREFVLPPENGDHSGRFVVLQNAEYAIKMPEEFVPPLGRRWAVFSRCGEAVVVENSAERGLSVARNSYVRHDYLQVGPSRLKSNKTETIFRDARKRKAPQSRPTVPQCHMGCS